MRRCGPAGGAWCTGWRSTQPVAAHPEHGLPDHLGVAAPRRAPTEERELVPLLIRARQLQQRGVHLAMPLPLLPQPEPVPRDGVGAGVYVQRVGIAEDGGSPHINAAAAMVLVSDSDHGMLLSSTSPSGRGCCSPRCARSATTPRVVRYRCGVAPRPQGGLPVGCPLPLEGAGLVVGFAGRPRCPELPCRAAPTPQAPHHSRLPGFLRCRDRSAWVVPFLRAARFSGCQKLQRSSSLLRDSFHWGRHGGGLPGCKPWYNTPSPTLRIRKKTKIFPLKNVPSGFDRRG